MPNKRNIKQSVILQLYANSGNKCSMYGCENTLVCEGNNLSAVCHIEAVNEGGARYNSNLDNEYINSYENLILLCPSCHTIVDKEIEKYTVQYLKEMKYVHEKNIREALEKKTFFDPTSIIDIDVNTIILGYKDYYGKWITKDSVHRKIELILGLNFEIRVLVYKIIKQCQTFKTNNVDIKMLYSTSYTEFSEFMTLIDLLERNRIIKEVKIRDTIDGYEMDGDWIIGNTNPVYKYYNGIWKLRKAGKILFVLYNMFGDVDDFHDFIINRNYDLLKKFEKKDK